MLDAAAELDTWSRVLLVRCPNRRAFLELLSHPAYAPMAPYKFMALEVAPVPVSAEALIPDLRPVVGALLLMAFLAVGWAKVARGRGSSLRLGRSFAATARGRARRSRVPVTGTTATREKRRSAFTAGSLTTMHRRTPRCSWSALGSSSTRTTEPRPEVELPRSTARDKGCPPLTAAPRSKREAPGR